MDQYQSSLPFNFPVEAPGHRDRLFFAVIPPLEVAAYIFSLAMRFCVDFDLAWKLLRQERFHCSLYCFPLREGVPNELVKLISKVASRISMAPFDVTFSSAESFVHKPRNHPLVLLGNGDEVSALRDFHRSMTVHLMRAGLARFVDTGFLPHVTTLYDDRAISRRPIIPVTWTVKEFVLIHSLVGKTEYRILGSWSLTSIPTGNSPPLVLLPMSSRRNSLTLRPGTLLDFAKAA